jgi:hypothetical protein
MSILVKDYCILCKEAMEANATLHVLEV